RCSRAVRRCRSVPSRSPLVLEFLVGEIDDDEVFLELAPGGAQFGRGETHELSFSLVGATERLERTGPRLGDSRGDIAIGAGQRGEGRERSLGFALVEPRPGDDDRELDTPGGVELRGLGSRGEADRTIGATEAPLAVGHEWEVLR